MPQGSAHLRRVTTAAGSVRDREAGLQASREKLREAIIAAHAGGESLSAIARAAGVSRQWVARIVQDT